MINQGPDGKKALKFLNFFPEWKVNNDLFDKVAAHIEASKDKPGCVLQPVPLDFVFGADKSLSIFLEMFSQLSLPGMSLIFVDTK